MPHYAPITPGTDITALRRAYVDQMNARAGLADTNEGTGSRRPIFRKVYSGPGYPIDPRRDASRAIDGYMNAFAKPASRRSKRTYDARPLREWLNKNVN